MIFYDDKLIKDLKEYSAQPAKADYIQITAAAKPNMFMYILSSARRRRRLIFRSFTPTTAALTRFGNFWKISA